jgi:hypothetical protein
MNANCSVSPAGSSRGSPGRFDPAPVFDRPSTERDNRLRRVKVQQLQARGPIAIANENDFR